MTPDASLPPADEPTSWKTMECLDCAPADEQRPADERIRGRIRVVGTADYSDEQGRPRLSGWATEGGQIGYDATAQGPDDPVMAGWTFRELHAIANGTGPNVERVRP